MGRTGGGVLLRVLDIRSKLEAATLGVGVPIIVNCVSELTRSLREAGLRLLEVHIETHLAIHAARVLSIPVMVRIEYTAAVDRKRGCSSSESW